MVGSLSYNPIVTTNASGSFNVESTGYIQGQAMDDPAIRHELFGGVLAVTETLPMYGGVGIYEQIGGLANGPGSVLGNILGRATGLYPGTGTPGNFNLVGFSVFDQDHSMIQSATQEVPVALSGMSVHGYRLGCGARIAVAMDPALIDLQGNIITSQVSWDFGGQKLIAGQAIYNANVITAATWAATAGGQSTYNTTSAHGIGVGEYVTFSGITPAAYNGTFLTLAGTTGSTIVTANPLASTPGAGTVFGTLVAGGGILPVQVLDVKATNCMTVQLNSAGAYIFNRNGACALIKI